MATSENYGTDFRYELGRVLGSQTFSKAVKLRELIKWLVEQALMGGKNGFSQYEIATGALGYGGGYDADSDSRVRIAVRRLREKLGLYYRTEGRLNRFRIRIDEGQYEPRLVAEDLQAAVASSLAARAGDDGRISVLVLPFLPVGFRDEQWVCDGLTLNLMRALAASGQARVVPWATAHWMAETTGDKREHHLKTGAQVILESLVQRTGERRWSIASQWVDGPTGLIDKFYEVRGGTGDLLSLIDDLAGRLAQDLRITYDERSRLQVAQRHSSDPAALTFYLKARRDALNFNPLVRARAIDLAGRAVGRDPYFAAAHALRAELHLGAREAGMGPAAPHIRVARESSERGLGLAPRLGDAVAVRGAIELTHDWELGRAEETLSAACSDVLAEEAPHWPPILDLARGKAEEAAMKFERWARFDPGSSGKASVASEFWYYARQFEAAIHWGLTALALDRQNPRAALFVAASRVEMGQAKEGLEIAQAIYESALESCEANLVLVALLAQAGRKSEARHVLGDWNRRKGEAYEPPIMLAIAYGWLGEFTLAMESMARVVEERQTVCLFAGVAPFLRPLQGRREFQRMLAGAGLGVRFAA